MNRSLFANACALAAMLVLAPAFGRPILYPQSTTVMLDYREDVMKEPGFRVLQNTNLLNLKQS